MKDRYEGQESRDGTHDTPEKEGHEQREVPVHFEKQHNEHNGAGRSTKIIPPHKVEGSNC